MSTTYEADGETWEVYLSDERPHQGVRALVFTCVTNSSHGWRVVEVPAGEYPSKDHVDEIEKAELRSLYNRSSPFDYPHDPKSKRGNVGHTPRRMPHHGA